MTLLQKLDLSEQKVVTIYLNSKKIRDFNNGDYQKLCFFLLKKCADFGKEKPPIIMEVINWAIEIGKAYPSLSIEDLNLAFTLAATGQLSWRSGDEFKSQNLDKFVWETFLTICKVSTGYIEYKRSKMKTFNKLIQDQASKKQSEDVYEEMWQKYVKEWKTNLYNAFKKFKKENVFELEDTYCSFFQQLNNSNLIELTANEIKQIKFIINQDIEEVINDKIKTIAGVEIKDIPDIRSKLKVDLFKVKCCSLAIKLQFEKWINDKKDVKQILTNINLKK